MGKRILLASAEEIYLRACKHLTLCKRNWNTCKKKCLNWYDPDFRFFLSKWKSRLLRQYARTVLSFFLWCWMSINSLCLNRNNEHKILTLIAGDSVKLQLLDVYWTVVKESTEVSGKVQPLLPVEDVMADLLLKNGRSRRRNITVIATQLVKQFS